MWYCWWFRNPASQLRLVVYPVISGGAGFLPSTVLWFSWKPRLGLQYSIQSYDGAAGVPPECSDVTHLEGSQYWADSLGMIQQVIRFWNFLMARCILLGWLDKWQSLCFFLMIGRTLLTGFFSLTPFLGTENSADTVCCVVMSTGVSTLLPLHVNANQFLLQTEQSKKDSPKTTVVVSFRNLEKIYPEPWIDFEGQQRGDKLCNQTPPSWPLHRNDLLRPMRLLLVSW